MHSFVLKDAVTGIDRWSGIPAYVELESDSEEKLKETAGLLDFQWKAAVFVEQHAYLNIITMY